MNWVSNEISPSAMALAWRLCCLFFLAALWLAGQTGVEGLFFLLVLASAALARWRFPRLPSWTILVDQALCAGAMFVWPQSVFGFALPVLDACAAGVPWLALPVLLVVTAMDSWSLGLAAALLCAVLAGLSLRTWTRSVERSRSAADGDRRERYALESLKSELLASNLRTARMAELAERARIARDLHDHAGHELTAAHLALQAYGKLREGGDAQAEEMLEEARRRVAAGVDLLRTTVHGLAPRRVAGLGAFEEICLRFTVCPVRLEVNGNTERIPVYVWSVLEPCLKEGLSNGARHGAPGGIDVSMDVGPRIVRMSVRNAYRAGTADAGGIGLRNLRQRARAVGGSVTVDASEGFRMVCVLPLGDEPTDDTPLPASREA